MANDRTEGGMGRVRIAALVLMVGTLAISGCGKSSKSLTQAELVQKANSICKRVSTEIASVNAHPANNAKDIARIASKLTAFEQSALVELGKLVPPDQLASDWKQFIAGAETLADNTAKLGEYAKTNKMQAAQGLIKSSTTVQERMKSIAGNDGFTECEQVS